MDKMTEYSRKTMINFLVSFLRILQRFADIFECLYILNFFKLHDQLQFTVSNLDVYKVEDFFSSHQESRKLPELWQSNGYHPRGPRTFTPNGVTLSRSNL